MVTTQTFEELALSNPRLELHRGVVREKPSMSIAHNYANVELYDQLYAQLDRRRFRARPNIGRVRRLHSTYYIPDIYVSPVEAMVQDRSRWHELEVFEQPLPLVVEIWSPSTGDYDIDEKIPEYMARGDWEIWRLHPFEPSLTVWRRQPDGSYDESRYEGGSVRIQSLPGVVIDLDTVFP